MGRPTLQGVAPLRIVAASSRMTKAPVVRLAPELAVQPARPASSYRGEARRCGERGDAPLAGVPDPNSYTVLARG